MLKEESEALFGFKDPLESSATDADVIDRNVAEAEDRQFLAKGLEATFVTRAVGGNGDMITFGPNDLDYTHLIVCNELGRSGVIPTDFGTYEGQNPAAQRVNVRTGKVETMLYGMARCDGIRTTQWGTIPATEESGADGGASRTRFCIRCAPPATGSPIVAARAERPTFVTGSVARRRARPSSSAPRSRPSPGRASRS